MKYQRMLVSLLRVLARLQKIYKTKGKTLNDFKFIIMDQSICLKTIFSVFAGERIKKVSDISENIKQSFNNVHNKLASISDIT